MKFPVCSRKRAAAFTCDEPWACISIATHEDTWPELSADNRVGLLRLSFHDIGLSTAANDKECIYRLFSMDQAREVLDFVEQMREVKGVETIMVHCEGGVSRSPGIAAALSKIYNGDDMMYFQRPYTPNSFVYNRILEVNTLH